MEVRLVSSVGMSIMSYPSDGATPHLGSAGGGRGLLTSPYTPRCQSKLEGHATVLLVTRWMNSTSHRIDVYRQGTDTLKI